MAANWKRKRREKFSSPKCRRKRGRFREESENSVGNELLARVLAMDEETEEAEMEEELMRNEIDFPAIALLMAKCSRFMGTMHDVHDYTDEEFPVQFHVSKSVFNELYSEISELPMIYREDGRSGRPSLPTEFQLQLFLYFLANAVPVQIVADKFKVSKSSVVNVVKRMTDSITKHMFPQYVAWPQDTQKIEIKQNFLNSYGISGVIGVLDAFYVPIKAHLEQPNLYKNDKGAHSVIFQAVCTEEMLITNCYTEGAGSLFKLQCLLSSPLFSSISEKFTPEEYLATGMDYTPSSWLLTPFPETDSPERLNFNRQLCQLRSCTSKTFTALLGRFPRISNVEMKYVEDISALLQVASTLHNFFILHGDDPNNYAQNLIEFGESKNPVVLIGDDHFTNKRDEIAQVCYRLTTEQFNYQVNL